MTTIRIGTFSPDLVWPIPMDPAGLMPERRLHLPPGDLLAINVYVQCPFCAEEFKVSAGFTSHLMLEHWCAREVALGWWFDLV